MISETEYKNLLDEGVSVLMESNYSDRSMREFCIMICQNILNKFDREYIATQFDLADFSNGPFTDSLSQSIEVGVISFMLQNGLYDKYLLSHKFKSLVALINYLIAYDMAAIFKEIGLNKSPHPCIYNNKALAILASRTYNTLTPLIALNLPSKDVDDYFLIQAIKEMESGK